MRLLDELLHDLGYAVRSMRREPMLISTIVATFALAAGANAAMYGLVSRLMLSAPPGVSDASRVVRVKRLLVTDEGTQYAMSTMSYPAFRAVSSMGRAVAGAAAVHADSMILGGAAEATRIAVVQASGSYFSLLGVRPARGRWFDAGDDVLPAGNAVVVLGDAFWKRRFAADESVLGREIVLGDEELTVIGIAPPGFNGDGLAPVDAYIPLTTAMRAQGNAWASAHGMNLVNVVARLRDGVALADAERAVAGAIAGVERSAGLTAEDIGAELQPLKPGRAARETVEARVALWLSGVALVVLLIAIANVATLLLLRALRRRREIGVRLALGIGRGRLARQLLGESLLLALVGSVVGALVARWISGVVRATLLPGLAPTEPLANARVLLAALLVSCVAGILAGLAPLVRTSVRNIAGELGAGDSGSPARSRLQSVLVMAQLSLSTVLLVGAGLFVRSLWRVQSQDLGYSTDRLMLVRLEPRVSLRGAERDRLYADAERRLAALPGVRAVTRVNAMPFAWHYIPAISVPGHAEPPGASEQLPIMYGATPAYLALMNVRLRAGRLFSAADGRGSPLVVLVNESMAREVWPGENALGRCVRIGRDPALPPSALAPPSLPCREVVGVVSDSRARLLRADSREASLMQYYVPFDQLPDPGAGGDWAAVNALLVGSVGSPDAIAPAIQRLIQGTSSVPLYASVSPYQDRFEPQLRPWRTGATLFTSFGIVALVLAAAGLFGVVSYVAQQRRREIGIRLALGASASNVRGTVIGGALRVATVGVGCGVSASLVCAPLVRSMLFETSPREPTVFAATVVTLLATALLAAAIPAWRSGRVSPLEALR